MKIKYYKKQCIKVIHSDPDNFIYIKIHDNDLYVWRRSENAWHYANGLFSKRYIKTYFDSITEKEAFIELL